MQAFRTHTGRMAPLRRASVDTDQIIPAEYLKRVSRTGFADGLFSGWRADPDFVLNQERYAGATILVAAEDFGVGSSREHAVWALQDFGFRVVVSSRFGDIFRANAAKCGLVTIEVESAAIGQIWQSCEDNPRSTMTVDLVRRELSVPHLGLAVPIEMDDYTRWRLMEGLDDIGLTLRQEEAIATYESRRPSFLPSTTASRSAT